MGVNCGTLLFFLQIFIAEAAIKAFLLVTIFLFQLDERLAVTGMGGRQTALLPLADNVIVFGFQFFPKGSGPPAQRITSLVAAVSVEECHHGVDDEQINGTVAECLG